MTTPKNSDTKPAPETLEWLMEKNRHGDRRIDLLSWGRLNRIYRSRKSDARIRREIEKAARRCGYNPATILSLNAY